MSDPTVLLLSMRRLSKLVGYSSLYEFEDLLKSITEVDTIEPYLERRIELFRRVYKYARLLSGSQQLALRCAPRLAREKLRRDYDLFVAAFNHPHELAALAVVPNWRERARCGVCIISELWLPMLPHYLIELLSEFDHVFVSSHNAQQEVARVSGRPCTYLPLASDVLKMAPARNPPPRSIDVANLGRRSSVTHAALLSFCSRAGYFYLYDSVAASGSNLKQRTFVVDDPSEHRLLLSSILQRTRFYITNRARANEPSLTVGGDEISTRFYEGAASGTIMIGDAPLSKEFDRQFDWPDAVIRAPFDSPDIADLLLELERDPERLTTIRRANIANAALRHDWIYRIETIFRAFQLPTTARMEARKQQLRLLDVGMRCWDESAPLRDEADTIHRGSVRPDALSAQRLRAPVYMQGSH